MTDEGYEIFSKSEDLEWHVIIPTLGSSTELPLELHSSQEPAQDEMRKEAEEVSSNSQILCSAKG